MKKFLLKNKNRIPYLLPTIYYLLFFAGCATSPAYVNPIPPVSPTTPGIYHKVMAGQTLWKISKIYGVELEELVRINHITDATAIEAGQQIFIPNRIKPVSQVTGYSDNEDFIWPLRGRVTASFGQTLNSMLNKGINIQPYARPEVLASANGKVVFIDDNFAGLGKTIIIEHAEGLFSVYGRNSVIFVKAGDNVQKGMVIARVGASGRDKNTHLHFEIRRGSVAQNPLYYLP